jgi:hypothetical protein
MPDNGVIFSNGIEAGGPDFIAPPKCKLRWPSVRAG